MTTPAPEVHDITDTGKELWDYLTGKEAAISYTFSDLEVQVPRRTGDDSPRATWKVNGTVQITTADRDTAR